MQVPATSKLLFWDIKVFVSHELIDHALNILEKRKYQIVILTLQSHVHMPPANYQGKYNHDHLLKYNL